VYQAAGCVLLMSMMHPIIQAELARTAQLRRTTTTQARRRRWRRTARRLALGLR
jgi:hypothetical protein